MLSELGFECGGALGGLLGLLVELFFEPVDLGAGLGGSILGSAGVVLCFLKLRLELGDPVAHALHLVGRRGMCLFEFGVELVGTVAVLGRLGDGDVDERLEVRSGDGRGVGVLPELGFERGDAVVRGGLGGCGGLRGVHGLASELVLEASDFGSAFCRVIRCGARIVLRCLKLGFELRDPLVDLLLGAG